MESGSGERSLRGVDEADFCLDYAKPIDAQALDFRVQVCFYFIERDVLARGDCDKRGDFCLRRRGFFRGGFWFFHGVDEWFFRGICRVMLNSTH